MGNSAWLTVATGVLVGGCLKIAANDALSSFETSLKRQKIGHPLRGRRQQSLLEEEEVGVVNC